MTGKFEPPSAVSVDDLTSAINNVGINGTRFDTDTRSHNTNTVTSASSSVNTQTSYPRSTSTIVQMIRTTEQAQGTNSSTYGFRTSIERNVNNQEHAVIVSSYNRVSNHKLVHGPPFPIK